MSQVARVCSFVFLVAACNNANPGIGGTSGGTGGNSGGPLIISVASVSSPAAIATIPPSSGRHFLEVDAGLRNDSSVAEPIAFPLFAVQTASGLRVQASAVTTQLPKPCAADQSLAPNGMTSCSLVFEVPTGETATMLVWLDPMTMATASSSVPMPTQPSFDALCNQAQMLRNVGSSSCQSCLMTKCVPASNDCYGGDYTCMMTCGSKTGSAHCMCLDQCGLTAKCQQELATSYECAMSTCGADCN